MDNKTPSTKKRTILVLTSSFPRYPGDYNGNFIFHLYSAFQESYSSKSKLIILAPLPDSNNKRYGEVKIKNTLIIRFKYFIQKHQHLYGDNGMIANIKSNPTIIQFMQVVLYLFSQIFNTIKICKKQKIDLIHAHWIVPQGIPGVICKKLFGIPLVISVHGTDIKLGHMSKIIKWIEKKILTDSDVIIANSKNVHDLIIELMGHPVEKIKIIPPGLEYDKSIEATKSHLKDKNNTRIILYVGRLIYQKGIYTLIRAIETISRYREDIKLCIIGDGPEREQITRMLQEKQLIPYVTILGYINKSEMGQYYKRSYLLVLPSIKKNKNVEGFGVVAAEAMAYKKPVIVTENCGISYLLKSYKTGIITKSDCDSELSKAISQLLSNIKLTKKIGVLGQRLVEKKLKVNTITKKYNKIYERCNNDNQCHI